MEANLDWQPDMTRNAFGSFRYLVALWVAGSIALALATWICLRLGLNLVTTAFVFLIAVVLLSLTGSLISSLVFSVAAVACLDFFFAPPLFSFYVDSPQDLATLLAFVVTSLLVVTSLVRRVRAQRKRAEEALRRTQETYLAEAQQLSHTGSFSWNVSSGDISWSEEGFRIFGYEATIKPSMAMMLERVHPDDVALVRAVTDRAAKEQHGFDFEYRLKLPDGSLKYLHIVARPMRDERGRLQFMGALMDVTARNEADRALRQNEQRYRNLFHNMPVALWRVDTRALAEMLDRLRAEGVTDLDAYIERHPDFLTRTMDAVTIAEVNARAVEMFGARDAGELTRSRARHWRESPQTYRRILDSRFRGEAMFQEETKLLTLDGRVIDVLMTAARPGLISDPGVSIVGFIDISERTRAREMVQRLQAEFAHASRVSMLGELTASIAHEISQPLAALRTNAETGLRWLDRPQPDVAKARELIGHILKDIARASDIVARVRAMAARRAPQQSPLSLHEIIEESVLFLRHELQSKGISVSLDLTPGLPRVAGDRTQLQQVVVNLAINAMQAMAHTARRSIHIRTTLSAPQTASCAIEDSGPGLDSEHLPRLFDSFFTTKEDGMGMGLSISRSIIEAHGGEIHADNGSSQGGACFTFTLPVATTSNAPTVADTTQQRGAS